MEDKDKIAHPHDVGYKSLLSFIKIFRQLLEDHVDVEWKKYLQFERAEKIQKSYILPEFKELESDVIYKVPLAKNNQEIFLYVLIEHQSTVDYSIAFRILLYLVEIWRDVWNNKTENERKSKAFRLPPVFPMVLYNGDATWTSTRSLRELVEEGELFGEYIPNFRYSLVNIGEIEETYLREKHNALSCVFLIEKKLGTPEFDETLNEALDFIKGEDHELFKAIIRWLLLGFKTEGLDTSNLEKIDFSGNFEKGKSMLKTQLEKIRNIGKIEATQNNILEVLKARFGKVPEALGDKIKVVTSEEKLLELIKKSATIFSLKDFEKAL